MDYFILVVRNVALVGCFVGLSAHPQAMREATPLHQQVHEAIDRALAARGFDRQAWIETAARLHRLAVREASADEASAATNGLSSYAKARSRFT